MRGIYTKTKGNEKMFESEEFELSSSRLIEVQLYSIVLKIIQTEAIA